MLLLMMMWFMCSSSAEQQAEYRIRIGAVWTHRVYSKPRYCINTRNVSSREPLVSFDVNKGSYASSPI